jgi:hypothetical protein
MATWRKPSGVFQRGWGGGGGGGAQILGGKAPLYDLAWSFGSWQWVVEAAK